MCDQSSDPSMHDLPVPRCDARRRHRNRGLRRPWPARFWAKVDVSAGPDACWPWLGSRSVDGYGHSRTPGRIVQGAHRTAYQVSVGSIPNGLHVLHRCDNPPCCNPAHLWLGTNADNVADRIAKGRSPSRDWPLREVPRRHMVCKRGHLIEGENAEPLRPGGFRCRECRRAAAREGLRRRRSAAKVA